MRDALYYLLTMVRWVLRRNIKRIVWNLFLAFVPLALSVWLFRREGRSRSLLWWLGFLVFFAFLPNAPYILTDVIHMIRDIRGIRSVWIVTLVVFPVHLLFILTGFEAYVLSLINMGYYLHRIGRSKWITGAELITHALCAIGIYLGRFPRFNSWDIVTQPDEVVVYTIEDLTNKRPLVIVFITFVIVAGLYWIMKQVTLGILLQTRKTKLATRQ